jgi:hypothetical protein
MKFSALCLTVISLNHINCQGQRAISDEQAMKELKHFYVSYITEFSQVGKVHDRKVDSLLKHYSTPKLTEQLKEQGEAGYDFFLNTNGPQIESAKTVQISKDNEEKDIYIVSFVYFRQPHAKDEIVHVKLRLIKTSTGILIDKIIQEGK